MRSSACMRRQNAAVVRVDRLDLSDQPRVAQPENRCSSLSGGEAAGSGAPNGRSCRAFVLEPGHLQPRLVAAALEHADLGLQDEIEELAVAELPGLAPARASVSCANRTPFIHSITAPPPPPPPAPPPGRRPPPAPRAATPRQAAPRGRRPRAPPSRPPAHRPVKKGGS